MERRTYNEFCGLAKALDVVGERWTLLVVRNLLLGPLRYSELLRGLPGITTNLLAKRLREMEAAGLLERIRTAGADGGQAYRLTPLGAELEPAIHALGRWGWHRLTQGARDEHRSLEWLLVALRRRYRGGAALVAELLADDTPYRVVLAPDRAEIGRGAPETPQLRVRGPSLSIARLFLAGLAPDAPPEGLVVEGDPTLLGTLVEAFDRGERPAVVAR